jgi:hypothetical protein
MSQLSCLASLSPTPGFHLHLLCLTGHASPLPLLLQTTPPPDPLETWGSPLLSCSYSLLLLSASVTVVINTSLLTNSCLPLPY